jgi:hypothetical protein
MTDVSGVGKTREREEAGQSLLQIIRKSEILRPALLFALLLLILNVSPVFGSGLRLQGALLAIVVCNV